mmetsp:Transcript_9159/g.26252  ORF Transcript_9159/g.26252 Transcript_9159/m.26252 type:complete len:326 (+) Transcript_9159:233-1210(+)
MINYPSFKNPYAAGGQPGGGGGHDAQRQQHITELVSQISAAVPMNHERTLFEVPMSMRSGGGNALLKITLPAGFPTERPQLSVLPPVIDSWADASGRLMFDALRHWQHPQSRLPAVVSMALSHFTSIPPPPPPLAAAAASAGGGPAAPKPQPPQALTIPSEFPALNDLSNEELVRLLTNPEAYQALLKKELEKLNAEAVLAEQQKRNAALAQRNLDMEAKFVEAKNHIAIVRSSEYSAAKQAFDDRVNRQAAAVKTLQPSLFLQALESKGAELEEQSEDLYSNFMAEDVPVDVFVDQYLKLRVEVNERLHRRQAAEVGHLLWGRH